MQLEHFYVNNPVCVPSRCSFLTGRYPQAHLSRDLGHALDPDEIHLFRVLKEAGYRLGLCGKNHALGQSELQLFDHIYEKGHQKTKIGSYKPYASGVDPTPASQYTTTLVMESAADFIKDEANGEQPFCLWLSFPDPHTPFQVPEPYASAIDPKTIPASSSVGEEKGKPLSQRLVHDLQNMNEASTDEIAEMKAVYYGMVKMIDDAVGRILKLIRSLDLEENTIVVFSSDHGEYLGDHGLVRKSLHFYDCLMRVPFLVRWKGEIPSGRIGDTMAESVDLLPTLLELANLPIPDGVQGKSLCPLLKGETGTHKSFVYAEAGNPGDTLIVQSAEEWKDKQTKPGPLWAVGAVQGSMLRTMDWKLCQYINGEGELYDLTKNPDETVNLYDLPEVSSVQLELTQQLVRSMMTKQDPVKPRGDLFDIKHA